MYTYTIVNQKFSQSPDAATAQQIIDMVMGCNADWGTDYCDSAEWQWLFCAPWTKIDNTPEGAALRIEWLLKNGLPENWQEQMCGLDPLCYK